MPPSPPRRVFGYARVSSQEQAAGTSLEDQQDALRKYARDRGLSVDRMFVETVSGGRRTLEQRVQMHALLATAQRGDLVLVDKLDRWSRDAEFSYKSIRELLEKGAGFYAVGEGIDASTSEGDTQLTFRIAFAREEHKRIRERLVGTRKRLRDKGYYVEGLPPWGYRRGDGEGLERHILALDADEAPSVRRAFELIAGGMSLSRVSREIGQPTYRLAKSIHCRTYLGEMRLSDGTWAPGRHPAIVDATLFARVQASLRSRRLGWSKGPRVGTRTEGWWLRDVARCLACGSKLSAAWGRGGNYFCCRAKCGVGYLRVDGAERDAEPLVVARLSELRVDMSRVTSPAPTFDLTSRRSKLAKRRERYLEAFADGHLDRKELRTRLEGLDGERTGLDALQAPAATPAERRAILADVERIEAAWRHADGPRRRTITNALAKSCLLQRGEPPCFTWRSADELGEVV